MAHKYQAFSDELFESDEETELHDTMEEVKADDGETDLVKKASAMVNQVTKEDEMLIMQTGETGPSYWEATGPQGGLEECVEEEEGELRESCHICGKKVVLLDKHIQANHGEEVKCHMCSESLPVDNMRWHILLEHCHNKCNKCSLCNQNFVSKSSLENHIKQVHLSQQECRDIPQTDNLTRHVKELHKRTMELCVHCGKDIDMSNLHKHMREVHDNEYTNCTECGKAITNSNLQMHIESEHKKVKQICEVCNEAFCIYAMYAHKRLVHNIGKQEILSSKGPKESAQFYFKK